jgi:hypothetical protein
VLRIDWNQRRNLVEGLRETRCGEPPIWHQAEKEVGKMSSILAAGTVAPTFTLRVTPDQNLTLTDLRGKPVILANDHGHLENSSLA